MKTAKSNVKYLALVLLTINIAAVGCSKSKRATRKTVGVELKALPCEDEAKTTKKYFRAFGMGDSQNLATAKQKAMLNAKQTVASMINSTLKSVTDNYINERTFGKESEFEAKFENMTREVIKQKLSNIEVVCQNNTTIKSTGMYQSFCAIQIDKEAILSQISNEISKNKKLQIDYDKMKFEQKFNEEMEKLERESVL